MQQCIVKIIIRRVPNCWWLLLFISMGLVGSAQSRIQLSLWHPLAIGRDSTVKNLSIGLVQSRTYMLSGLGVSAIGAEAIRFNGVQFSGLYAYVKENGRGVLTSGLLNVVRGTMRGVEITLLHNMSMGTMDGIQLSGVSNMAIQRLRGVQIPVLTMWRQVQ